MRSEWESCGLWAVCPGLRHPGALLGVDRGPLGHKNEPFGCERASISAPVADRNDLCRAGCRGWLPSCRRAMVYLDSALGILDAPGRAYLAPAPRCTLHSGWAMRRFSGPCDPVGSM